MSGKLQEEASYPSFDKDFFPGCKFDVKSNLILLFDPLESNVTETVKVDPIHFVENDFKSVEIERVRETEMEKEQDMNQVQDATLDMGLDSNECLASSLDSTDFKQRLLEATPDDDVTSEASSVASFTSLGIAYPAIEIQRSNSVIDTQASMSMLKPSSDPYVKPISNASSQKYIAAALARWKAEKRRVMLQEQEAKTKKVKAFQALAESTDEILMSMKVKHKLKRHAKERFTTLKSPKTTVSNNLQALQLLVEQKKRRTMEWNQLVQKKVLQKEKNMMALRSRLDQEFKKNPPPLQKSKHFHTTFFNHPISNQLNSKPIRLSPLAQNETEIHQVLVRAVATLSQLPLEIHQHLMDLQSNSLSSSKLKPIPCPVPPRLKTLSSSSSSITLAPHPSLQLSPSSLTLSKIKPKLSFTFTNISDTILRVSILPFELNVEDVLTLSSTPTLSLPKGLSIASQVCLNLEFLSHPLLAVSTHDLRLSVNGNVYTWPISILADQFKLDYSPKCIEFFSCQCRQQLCLSNKGTLGDEIELRCDGSNVSISPSKLKLDALKSQTILLEWHSNEESSRNANLSTQGASKETSMSLSIWSLSKNTPLVQIPLNFHKTISPLTLYPLETEFFYCPTNFQIQTEVVLKNNLKHGVRYQTKTILEPDLDHFQVKLKPATSVVQVDTPTCIQIQLSCISPNVIDSSTKVTCQIIVDALKNNRYTFLLHGHFFNPDFLMSVHQLRWQAMSLNETYQHAFTITNPTPVVMELHMTYTCSNACIQFIPLESESLVLAPGQTASGWLQICPYQSGPLQGEIQWKNVFGIVKSIPMTSYVFQPFAQFSQSSYEFDPVCVGHVSRRSMKFSWCLSDRERKKTASHSEELGKYEFCSPELVMLNGKPCTLHEKNLVKEKSPFRMYPHQGQFKWGSQCFIHVAFAPTQFLADPQFEKQKSLAFENLTLSSEIDSKPNSPSGSSKHSASRRLSSAGSQVAGNSLKPNSANSSTSTTPTSSTSPSLLPTNGSKSRPISSKSQLPSINNPTSTFTQALPPQTSTSHLSKSVLDPCLLDLPFQSSVEVYRVPIYFSLLQRRTPYEVDHRPSRYLSFLYFQCTTFTTTWKLSSNLIEFPITPVGFHSLQTLHVNNPHPNQALTLTSSFPPQSPFSFISALRLIPPKSTASLRLGFFPILDQVLVTHRLLLRSGATECGITLKGVGQSCHVTLSNDTLDPWIPLQASFGHVCWNEPKTLTWSIQNSGSIPLSTRWRSSKVETAPPSSTSSWLEWIFPDRLPSQSTTSMTFTCLATLVGQCQAKVDFFILGLGDRSLKLHAHVHRFTAFCEAKVQVPGSSKESTIQNTPNDTSLPFKAISETEFQLELSSTFYEEVTFELTHLKPNNVIGIKLDPKRPVLATFTFQTPSAFQLDLSEPTNPISLEMGKSMVVKMKKVITSMPQEIDKKEDHKVKIVVTGGLDLIAKKVIATTSPVVYHIKCINE